MNEPLTLASNLQFETFMELQRLLQIAYPWCRLPTIVVVLSAILPPMRHTGRETAHLKIFNGLIRDIKHFG